MNTRKLLLLHRRQWVENRKLYYTGLMAMTGIISFLFLIVWHFRDSFGGDSHRGIFLIGLFAGGGLFTATLLKDAGRPATAIWLFGLPASSMEKLVLLVFHAVVLYLLVFLVIFFSVESMFVWMVHGKLNRSELTDLLKNDFYDFLFTFINFQLLVLLGSLSFRKLAFLKTILLMIACFSLLNSLNNNFLMMITGERSINSGTLFGYFQFEHEGENVYVYLPENLGMAVTIFFHYLLPFILYYITWLKFRETEL